MRKLVLISLVLSSLVVVGCDGGMTEPRTIGPRECNDCMASRPIAAPRARVINER